MTPLEVFRAIMLKMSPHSSISIIFARDGVDFDFGNITGNVAYLDIGSGYIMRFVFLEKEYVIRLCYMDNIAEDYSGEWLEEPTPCEMTKLRLYL